MNLLKRILFLTGFIAVIFLFQSCLDDDNDNNYYANALVTVKQGTSNTIYLQLDDKTTLYPVNLKTSPFGSKEVRALTNCKIVNESANGYNKAVYVNWIDSLLTKSTVADMGTQNTSMYGDDPVEIVNDWVTIAEDGYLTLRFRTLWGGKRHLVNLLTGGNSSNPYEVEFRQNSFGDTEGSMQDALVAFRLNNLPDTNGKTVKLKLKWKSFTGEKTAEFDYCTRAASSSKLSLPEERCIMQLK